MTFFEHSIGWNPKNTKILKNIILNIDSVNQSNNHIHFVATLQNTYPFSRKRTNTWRFWIIPSVETQGIQRGEENTCTLIKANTEGIPGVKYSKEEQLNLRSWDPGILALRIFYIYLGISGIQVHFNRNVLFFKNWSRWAPGSWDLLRLFSCGRFFLKKCFFYSSKTN